MRLVRVGLCLLVSCVAASAQSKHHGQGYAFFAPGATSPGWLATAHFGFGGEGLVYKGVGLGAELGYLTFWRNFSGGVGAFSLDGPYHLLPSRGRRRTAPFVTAGYTLFFRSGTQNLFNFGGGLN